jgi:hypothetical protein
VGVIFPSVGGSSNKIEGGLIELSSDQPGTVHDAIASFLKLSADGDDNPTSTRNASKDAEMRSSDISASPDIAVRSTADSATRSSLRDALSPSEPRRSDGVSVELDSEERDEKPRAWLSVSDPLPKDDSWWDGEPRRPRDSIALELEQEQEYLMAREKDAAQRPGKDTESEDAAADVANTDGESNVEEGGLIEIIAAANSDVVAPHLESVAPSDVSHRNVQAVRMDTGVGLYQVFEVAVAPRHNPGEPPLAATEVGSPLAITAAEPAAGTVEEAAPSNEPGTGLFRAASVSSIVAAASLVFMRKRKTEPQEIGLFRRPRRIRR